MTMTMGITKTMFRMSISPRENSNRVLVCCPGLIDQFDLTVTPGAPVGTQVAEHFARFLTPSCLPEHDSIALDGLGTGRETRHTLVVTCQSGRVKCEVRKGWHGVGFDRQLAKILRTPKTPKPSADGSLLVILTN